MSEPDLTVLHVPLDKGHCDPILAGLLTDPEALANLSVSDLFGGVGDMLDPLYVSHMVRGYLTCGLWADAQDDDQEPLENADDTYDVEDFTEESMAKATEIVTSFIEANLDDLRAYAANRDYDPNQGTIADYAGHDLWLTQNGHGAGFWDRGLGEVGDRLSASAKPYGSHYVYVDANGKCHLEG